MGMSGHVRFVFGEWFGGDGEELHKRKEKELKRQ
jgi:hypothetical protein